jgi:Uncharacterised nucleotidyltransferase
MNEESLKSLQLIGACLAPFDQGRVELLEERTDVVSDWEQVMRLCGARYVTPLVYAQIHAAGMDAQIPDETRKKFKRLYLQTAALNTLRIQKVMKVNSILAEMGVDALVYKGGSLVMGGDYPDPGQRMFSDIDILVDESKKDNVDEAFIKAGEWKKLPQLLDRPWEDTKYMDDWRNLIEVHWQLKPLNGVSHEVSEKRLFKNAVKTKYKKGTAFIPSAEDRYIQAALHSTANHPFDSTFLFIMVSDLAHIAAKKDLDWLKIVEEMKNECMHEHGMIATRLSYQLTEYEPLLEGIEVFKKTLPGIEETTNDLTNSLVKMMMKPWVFSSNAEMKFFLRKSVLRRAGFIKDYFKEKISPTKFYKPEQSTEDIGIISLARYKRNFFDPDFLRYLFELYRFYNKINYTSHEVTKDHDC